MEPESPKRRPSISQLSKTPSWVMLGFILGAVTVWKLPRDESSPRPIVVRSYQPETRVRATAPRDLTTIEAVFEHWSQYAVWDADITQVALWNAEIGSYAEFYEVRRIDGAFYFRSIPQLTNRILRHGKLPPTECPLQFTETEAQYREWHDQDRFERPVDISPPSLPVERTLPLAPKPSVDPRSARPLTPRAPTPDLPPEPAK